MHGRVFNAKLKDKELTLQYVSLGSPSFIMYPEIKVTEVYLFQKKKTLFTHFLFEDNVRKLGESKETHCMAARRGVSGESS